MASELRAQSVALHVSRTLAGDKASFEALVREYQAGVQGLVYHLMGNFTDTQDIVQEAFVTAYTRLGQLQNPARFGPWLKTIAQNECRMRWRRQRDTVPLEHLGPAGEATDVVGVDERLASAEDSGRVRQALARLPEALRLTLTLHYIADWSYAEIAEFLGVPVTTVVGRMHRARRLMQERMEPMLRETFQAERMADARIAEIVAAAMGRAKDANEKWEKSAFLAGVDDALASLDPTSSDPQVAMGRVEALGMRGDARATWIGDVPGATHDYLQAIATADEAGQDEDAARLCKDLVAAYLRSREFEAGRNAAAKAVERFRALDDHAHAAQMQAAVDLCDGLPGVWVSGGTGGYAMAGFALTQDAEGITLETPASSRNYGAGGPSPATALAWLLYPARLLGSDLTVGAIWTDQVDRKTGAAMLWPLPDGYDLVSRSAVESDSDIVVTPAGRFEGCLRVRTVITAPDGSVSPAYVARAHGGERVAWYARGVGCVKIRHDTHNDRVRTLALMSYEAAGDDYLPLHVGAQWRYQWTHGGYGGPKPLAIYEDLARVVAVAGSTAFLSSATVAGEPEDDLCDAHVERMLECERASGDAAGLAASLEARRARMTDDAGPEARQATAAEIADLYAEVGPPRREIDARWRLQEVDGKLPPDLAVERARELVGAADADGCWQARSRATWLLGVGLKDSGRGDEAQEALRASAAISADAGDVVGTANAESWADRFLLDSVVPEDDVHGYCSGEIRLLEKDGHVDGANSSSCTYYGYPPGPPGFPLTSFAMIGPYLGIQVLTKEVGAADSDRLNVRMPWGGESAMVNSVLAETAASVTTPGGQFDGCALIESKHELHVGRGAGRPPQGDAIGYVSGAQQSWFAPGVGVVRVLRRHDNDYTTDLILRSHSGPTSDGFDGLTIGRRWEYTCADESTGTEYEHFVRVAAKIGSTWLVVFVTRATAAEPA